MSQEVDGRCLSFGGANGFEVMAKDDFTVMVADDFTVMTAAGAVGVKGV